MVNYSKVSVFLMMSFNFNKYYLISSPFFFFYLWNSLPVLVAQPAEQLPQIHVTSRITSLLSYFISLLIHSKSPTQSLMASRPYDIVGSFPIFFEPLTDHAEFRKPPPQIETPPLMDVEEMVSFLYFYFYFFLLVRYFFVGK